MWTLLSLLACESPPATDGPSRPSPTVPTTPAVDRCAGQPTGVQIGDCHPDFTLPDATGTDLTLSELRGDVLVVDLAAVWCEPCYDLAPQLQALQEEHGAAGLTVVTMIVQNVRGANPTVDDAADWVAELGVSYPVVADVLGIRHVEWLDDPRVLQVPRTVVADRDGIVRGVSASADGTALEELAVELL